MTLPTSDAARRLQRLERLLAGRQARFAAKLASSRRPSSTGPVGILQRYGYPAAVVLALSALLPTVVGFGWRRRKLLAGAAANRLAIGRLRQRVESIRSASSVR